MPATHAASTEPPAPRQRLAAAWRLPEGSGGELDRVGVLEIDWSAGRVSVQADHPAPGRAHGLHALPDGGFVAVAGRPGRWLLRCDAEGRLVQHHTLAGAQEPHTLGGHALLSADGRHLFTCETHPDTGEGWIGVRAPDTLRRIGGFSSQGLDPHQMVLDGEGQLWVANGGIPRLPDGRKTAMERMAPSLVRLAASDGRLLAEHRLADARVSLRHLAWAEDGSGRLGVALQAEHDDEARRRDAPLLAVLEAGRLVLPSQDTQGIGYAGDIAAGPGGGFVLSGQKAGRGLWWHPGAAERLTRVAELGDACALAAWDGGRGVLIAARLGLARWHVSDAPRLLRWPMPMSPDNHWLLLDPAA
ncbi:MAG: DUF1513 domain-containing protein [Burkholderiales bacterium]|nr:DUF1513 domain-containing protein [Burkholderiales bacterium]